ncbi:spinster family MFS transporter [Massilia niastensis]|uniref:spinster family MFS transporter n=1 Tax=Massilia niastensis TaxID=544911 RepID=UPI000381A436|nr:MFS transporter [Massilia niastensis]
MPHSRIPTVSPRAHLSLALLALVYVFSYIDRQVISILIEPIKREFGVSDTAMGMLTGLAFALLYAGLGVPVGKLADRGNRRNIIAVCCGLWSLATLACGLVPRFWMLLVARMSVAIGEAGGMAPAISLVSDLYPKERRSLVITLFMMGPHLGVLIGLALGGWIAQQYGWRATFLWFGAPGLVLAALVWLLVREPRRGAFDAAPADAAPTRMLALLAIPAFRNVCLACGVAGVAGYGYGIWTPSFLVRSHGMSIAHAGLVFGVISGVGAVAGSLVSGLLCDRLARRDARWQLGLPMLGVALSIPAALAFFLWPSGGHWMLGTVLVPHTIVFAFAFSLFASWWPALSYSATSLMIPAHQRSTAAATLNLFITLFGLGIGPMATGFLSDLFLPLYGQQGLRYALASAMCLLVFPVLLYGMAMRPYRARLASMALPVPNPL